MERLRNQCELILLKYQERKYLFEQKIESWRQRGYDDSYKKGKYLFNVLEELKEKLQFQLSQASNQINYSVFKADLKLFKKSYKQLHESCKPVWRQWIEAIVIALGLAFLLRHTIFSPYHVPTGSAEPNILVGDRIWGNKMAYWFSDVKRGDLIIFDDPRPVYAKPSNMVQALWQKYVGFEIPLLGLPGGPINVVKRVVALPGDTIEGKIENGKTVLYLNGKKIEEPYLNTLPLIGARRHIGLLPFDGFGPFRVPQFLRMHTDETLRYTYDPSKSYEDQPYYKLSKEEVRFKNGSNEPILYPAQTPNYTMSSDDRSFYSVDSFGPITLPEGMYWAMGDSRKNSDDSRYWGPVHRSYIRGRASFILFSIDSEEAFWLFSLIKHPVDFWTKYIRWNRFLKPLPRIPAVPVQIHE